MSDLPGESLGVSDLFTQDLDVAHHDIYDRHEFGKAFPIPGFPANILTSGTPKPGNSMAPARADHQHLIASASVRKATIHASPVITAGDVPPLNGTGGPIAATLVSLPAVAYNRFAQVSISGGLSFPVGSTGKGEYAALGLQVDGVPVAGSGFGVQPLPFNIIPFTRNSISQTYVVLNYSGHREIYANFTWNFQITMACTDATYSVYNPANIRMTILVVPESSL